MVTINFRSLANESIRNLTPYQPGKPIEELERELGIKNAIKLASNENPLGASPAAVQAAIDAIKKIHLYPDGNGYEIKNVLSEFLSISPQQITLGNGSENILELIVKAYLHQGDHAVISEYAFLTIPIILKSYGITIKTAPAHCFGHDIAKMVHAIDKKTKILFLVNPNNPTGTYTTESDFLNLMQAVPPDVLVVVDEAYSEYTQTFNCPNALNYLNQFPNLIVTRTFSKAYGLASLRLGYSISSFEIADILNRARLPFNVNTIASSAACAAIKDQTHVKKSIELNNQGLIQMEDGLKKLRLNYIPSVCNFVTVHVGDAQKIYTKLLYDGVIVRPLNAYQLSEYVRITIGTPEQNEKCLASLYKIVQSYATV